MDEEFYTIAEIAEKLKVSKMTVYRYIKSKKLPAHKIGRDYRIQQKDFQRFLAETRFF